MPLLTHELAHGPELWLQKGYLARAVTLDGRGSVDQGVAPLEHFVEEQGPDAVAVTIETDPSGTIHPVAYLRKGGKLREVALDPHPLNAFDNDEYQRELTSLLQLGS